MTVSSHADLRGPVYSMLADDPDFRELLALFVDSVPEKRAALCSAFEAGRWTDLQAEAHRLKGAAAGYGFAELSALAAQLEHTCRSGPEREPIETALNDVLHHLVRLRATP